MSKLSNSQIEAQIRAMEVAIKFDSGASLKRRLKRISEYRAELEARRAAGASPKASEIQQTRAGTKGMP